LTARYSQILTASTEVSLVLHNRLGLPCPLDCPRRFQVHGVRCLLLKSVLLPSRKAGYAVLEFWPAQECSDYGDGVKI
jgi:hypothetical protein